MTDSVNRTQIPITAADMRKALRSAAPRPCQRKGCIQHAKGALTISIPMPPTEESPAPAPIVFFVGAELCGEHIASFDVPGFLSNAIQMQLARRLVALGHQRPEFQKAWANAVAVDDPGWLQFKAGIADAAKADGETLQ